MLYTIGYSCVSHIGMIRKMNQDNFICNGVYMNVDGNGPKFPLSGEVSVKPFALFGVFDGMGGEECGEIASYIAARESARLAAGKDPVIALDDFCIHANASICEYASNNGVSSMGTTAAMLMFGKKKITLCNIGDSKIYRFANNEIEQISKDHVAISAYGTKAPLLQNLGIPEEEMRIEPYYAQGAYVEGDRYLICSDGLTDMVNVETIRDMLADKSIENAVNRLLNTALENGGRDNTTIILLEVRRA
ncbi:MAG: serine/threonine-protein phosphatase [Clostridia bacterium]|nr:serine/threonine-protein phosphatase [Clostridia bacterium]